TINIPTHYGVVQVNKQGAANRTVIVTYHDIAYNSATQFHQFFSFTEMAPITQSFTIYHINALGQEDQAKPLSSNQPYPTMEQLAETVQDVFTHLNIKSAIGFGVGAGANVLARFARPAKDVMNENWSESLKNFLISYHLGNETQSTHLGLVQSVRRHLEEDVNPRNVMKYVNSYFKRTSITMEQPSDANKNSVPSKTLKCSVINVTGFSSPHKNDVFFTNDKCDPSKSSLVEFADCGGFVLEEQPAKMAEAFRLFLQGLGTLSHLSIPRYSTADRLAEQTIDFKKKYGSHKAAPRRLSAPYSSHEYTPRRPSQMYEHSLHSINDYDEKNEIL
ncbi:unnamed protein product, partial [Didymodactylos carnosus]